MGWEVYLRGTGGTGSSGRSYDGTVPAKIPFGGRTVQRGMEAMFATKSKGDAVVIERKTVKEIKRKALEGMVKKGRDRELK